MRIGVVDLQMAGWAAGAVVSRIMALSLQAAGADVIFLSNTPKEEFECRTFSIPAPHYFPGEWTFRRIAQLGEKNNLLKTARRAGVDVILPLTMPFSSSSFRKIGWIPDMQHRHLPELFPKSQLIELDRRFKSLAQKSDRLMFSSHAAASTFLSAFPQFSQMVRIASFPSLFTFQCPAHLSSNAVEKYHLSKRFLLVINQFWRHKNHRTVVEALALLRQHGKHVQVVMAGVPVDYRDRRNSTLSDIFQIAATKNVWDQCVILGEIPREDILSLLRNTTAVIQPSRFEGWNTTVQDAKALGCPLFLSDLPVHREQCPDALGFFPAENAEALAKLISDHWDMLPTRPDEEGEKVALSKEFAFAKSYGHILNNICSETVL